MKNVSVEDRQKIVDFLNKKIESVRYFKYKMEMWQEYLTKIDDLPDSMLAGLARQLVDAGMDLRVKAYSEADEVTQKQIPGGIFTRMLGNNLSSEADEYDRLALILVNSNENWEDHQKLNLLI